MSEQRQRSIPRPNPNPPLGFEEMARGVQMAYQNAISLLEDAKILYDAKRYPRCVSLSILAQEEVSKIPQITQLLYVTDSVGRPITLDRFQVEFKSHKRKIVEFMSMYLMDDILFKGGKQVRKMKEKPKEPRPKNSWDFSEMKERGFYVSFDEKTKKFSSPTDVIGEILAKECIEKLEEHLLLYKGFCEKPVDEMVKLFPEMLKKLEDNKAREFYDRSAKRVIAELS